PIVPPSPTSAGTGTGSNTWSEVRWKRGQMFRVGPDLSKNWKNVVKVRVEITTTDSTVAPIVAFNSISIFGDGAADIGSDGLPYQYRYRGRDSKTGTVGGYSPISRSDTLASRDSITLWLNGLVITECD